jgi:hypothetical protein
MPVWSNKNLLLPVVPNRPFLKKRRTSGAVRFTLSVHLKNHRDFVGAYSPKTTCSITSFSSLVPRLLDRALDDIAGNTFLAGFLDSRGQARIAVQVRPARQRP